MAKKLIGVQDPNLIQSGIVKSLHKTQVPLWIDGQNVVFEDGAVRSSPGRISIFISPISEPPVTGIQDVLVGTTGNLVFGDNENLYRWDGTAVTTDGTGYSGSTDRGAFQDSAFQDDAFQEQTVLRASLWSMESWGTWALASNGVDIIQINKMTGAGFVALSGTPPSFAECIVKYKQYLLAFNTDLGGAYIEFCDTDNVEDWVNGAAGFLFVRDLDSDIICARKMGEVVAFYSTNTMGIVQYLGPDFYFGAKVVLSGIGATGKFSVIEYNKQNWGISFQGIWRTDGTGFAYISPPLLREWLQTHINWGAGSKIAGFANEDRSMLEWGIPIDGSSENNATICCNLSNPDNPIWTFRDYGITCGLKKNIFRFPIFGLSSGEILYGEYGVDGDGESQDCWVQTRPMQSDDELLWKDVEFIIARFHDLVGTVEMQIGVQENLDDDIVWSDAVEAITSSGNIYPASGFSFGAGRWISLKIRSNSLGAKWRFSGFDLWGSLTGVNI